MCVCVRALDRITQHPRNDGTERHEGIPFRDGSQQAAGALAPANEIIITNNMKGERESMCLYKIAFQLLMESIDLPEGAAAAAAGSDRMCCGGTRRSDP